MRRAEKNLCDSSPESLEVRETIDHSSQPLTAGMAANSIHYVKSTQFDLHVGKGFFHGVDYSLLAVVVDEDKIELFAGFAANFDQFSQQLLVTLRTKK